MKPDVLCLPTEEDLREERDPCLLKAVSLARKAAGREAELPPKLQGQVAGLLSSMKEYHDEQRRRPD